MNAPEKINSRRLFRIIIDIIKEVAGIMEY